MMNESGERLMTRLEAEALVAALVALRAIEARAGRAAYRADGSGEGRVAGTADLAGDAVFQVLNVASAWCRDSIAAAAIEWNRVALEEGPA